MHGWMDGWMQLLAGGIAVGVLVHSTLHITCDLPKLVTANPLEFDKALGNDFHFKQPSYGEILKTPVGITGLLMLILMLLAFLLAMYWFRRNLVKLPWPFHRMTGFNAFWYSHHLFVLVYALLFVHSTDLLLPDPWWQKSVRIPSFFLSFFLSFPGGPNPLIWLLFECSSLS
jgi:respiratory burst oxidase